MNLININSNLQLQNLAQLLQTFTNLT